MAFFRKLFKTKTPNLKKYTNEINIKNTKFDNIEIKNYQTNIRSQINDLNKKFGTRGIFGDNLSQSQIDEVVKNVTEKKLKKLDDKNINNIEFDEGDIEDIAKDFKKLKNQNLKNIRKKQFEWTVKITALGLGIWRGIIAISELENQEKMLDELDKQSKKLNEEKEKSDSEEEKSKIDIELEELDKLKDQANVLGNALNYLSDEEYKFYLSLSPENRLKYLIDLGLISVNDDGSIKFRINKWIIYIAIAIFVILIIILFILIL